MRALEGRAMDQARGPLAMTNITRSSAGLWVTARTALHDVADPTSAARPKAM